MAALTFRFYRNILSKDRNLLDKLRLRILFCCIFTFTVLTVILSVISMLGFTGLPSYTVLIFCSFFACSFHLLLSNQPSGFAAHLFLITVVLVIWTNVLLVNQNLYLVNFQFCLLAILLGYYIFGSRVGLSYSVLAIAPLLMDIFIRDFLNFHIPSRQLIVNSIAYCITVSTNFVLILYINHLFFRSLTTLEKRESSYEQRLKVARIHSKEVAQSKNNFLNTMSHEIRTPLNAIVGMSNLLMTGNMLKEQEESIRVLEFSAQNLMSTVNNIVDFNSLDAGNILLESKPFNFGQTIANVCATFKEAAFDKALRFECVIDEKLNDVMVTGDELRLSQILFHFIGNAIKHTEAGFVAVNLRQNKIDQQFITVGFQIRDSGIGMSTAIQKQILNPFDKKALSNQRQFQVSLGLSIASQLLQIHHSKLEITSSECIGSDFQFEIIYPLSHIGAVTEHFATTAQYEDMSAIKVLCVDDEKLNLLIVKKILAKWNIVTDEAVNGQIAVEMCRSKAYDVVLMDINMPVMDGFEASCLIKSLIKLKWEPPVIIALTASVGAAKDEVLESPNIDDCILKPFRAEELRGKLHQIMISRFGKMEVFCAGDSAVTNKTLVHTNDWVTRVGSHSNS